MLHRPAEKKWTYKQPPEPFPPCPSRGCFLGPSGSGKSTTLISMLLGPYKNDFDSVYVFSPSVEIDSCWDPVMEHAKHPKGHGFFSEWDDRAMWAILNAKRDGIKELKSRSLQSPCRSVW